MSSREGPIRLQMLQRQSACLVTVLDFIHVWPWKRLEQPFTCAPSSWCCSLLRLPHLSQLWSSVPFQPPLCVVGWPTDACLSGMKVLVVLNHLWGRLPSGLGYLVVHMWHRCSCALSQSLGCASVSISVHINKQLNATHYSPSSWYQIYIHFHMINNRWKIFDMNTGIVERNSRNQQSVVSVVISEGYLQQHFQHCYDVQQQFCSFLL